MRRYHLEWDRLGVLREETRRVRRGGRHCRRRLKRSSNRGVLKRLEVRCSSSSRCVQVDLRAGWESQRMFR